MHLKITIILALVALKAITIGSDFNFWYWIKWGKIYTEWYFNKERTTFIEPYPTFKQEHEMEGTDF